MSSFNRLLAISDLLFEKLYCDKKQNGLFIKISNLYFKKMPKKYRQLVLRTLNYSKISSSLKLYGYDLSPGAGTILSQLGLIMSMTFCQLNDLLAKSLYLSIMNKYKQSGIKNKTTLLNMYTLQPSWVLAAYNTRISLKNAIKNRYKDLLIHVLSICWDNLNLLKLIGFNMKLKGFSTDMFVKLTTGLFMQVSLKKNYEVFLLNSSLYKTIGIKSKDLTKRQSLIYKQFYELNKLLILLILKNTDDVLIIDIKNKLKKDLTKDSKYQRKLLLAMMKHMKKPDYILRLRNNYTLFVSNAARLLKEDTGKTLNFLNKISLSLPIKLILEDKLTMLIGDKLIDSTILKLTLGIKSYDLFISKLQIIPKEGTDQFLIKHGDVFITTVQIRLKGLFYNGTLGVEATLDKRFYLHISTKNQLKFTSKTNEN